MWKKGWRRGGRTGDERPLFGSSNSYQIRRYLIAYLSKKLSPMIMQICAADSTRRDLDLFAVLVSPQSCE